MIRKDLFLFQKSLALKTLANKIPLVNVFSLHNLLFNGILFFSEWFFFVEGDGSPQVYETDVLLLRRTNY